jgi:hypothetical protein
MSFTNNELFLIGIICILCAVIGGLIHHIYLKHKAFKVLTEEIECFTAFTNKVFDNIAIRENIDIKKYIDMTHQQVHSRKEGGEL